MKNLNKIATGIALSLNMGLAASAFAHPGQMSGNMGGGHHGMQGGGHGMQHDKGSQHHGGQDRHAARQLMTPEERTAMREKMRAAATPEERQQIAAANRAEMQKRAQEKGITLPEHRGPHGHAGMGAHAVPQVPEAATPAQ